VQAELLGKFHTLKYFPDDLEKELSYPVEQKQQLLWQENTSRRAGSLTATEEVDAIRKLFVALVRERAASLDALSGPASVSKEGSYERGAFLVSQEPADSEPQLCAAM